MKMAIKEGQYIVKKTFANKGLEWKFMPPMSPQFGGLHEAAMPVDAPIISCSIKNLLSKCDMCTNVAQRGIE